MNHLKSVVIGLLLSVAATVAATNLPDIGDTSGAVVSPELERRMGEAFIRQIRRVAVIMDDPEVQEYVDALGHRLASHSSESRQDFYFFVVDDPTINAFAAPGGYVGLHTGLFLSSRSESELASVLAHEIAHVTQRHMARTFERAGQLSLPLAAAMLGAALLGLQNPEAAQAAFAAVMAGSQQYQINFTRANEQEADRIGMELLAAAGFDSRGMPSFFERLQIANRLNDPKNFPEFLRTHPVTVTRIADSRNRAEQLPSRDYKDSLTYHLVRAKLLVAAAEDPVEAVKYYEALMRSGGYKDENVARYGYALALTKAGEYGKASVQVQRLITGDHPQLAYLLAAARLTIADQRVDEGLGIYAKALQSHPDSRPVMLGYADALLDANRGAQARKLLRRYTKHHEPDIAYYTLLAEAEGRAGSVVESHMALAEVYYLNGETARAQDQLKIAQKIEPMSNYHRERVDARLKELQKELDEEKKLKGV